jgi:hypothetical protein
MMNTDETKTNRRSFLAAMAIFRNGVLKTITIHK